MPEEVIEEMREITDALLSAEVTRAVRDARVGDREMPEGAYMGFLDGELLVVEGSIEEAALTLAKKIVDEGADVVTLLGGKDLDEVTLQRIAHGIRDLDDAVEVEVRDGGQPLYPLQMVAE